VQNHPNVIKYYAYFLSETRYNSFKIGIVTELMDKATNLEVLYRKRKKAGLNWGESEMVNMYCSLISTCSFLQSKGICHRDVKPANLFLLPSNEVKLIDFG
jgi:serine/threonine protein kinase